MTTKTARTWCIALGLLLGPIMPSAVAAQETDSLWQVDLGEIVVGGAHHMARAAPADVRRVDAAALQQAAPLAAGEALRLVPGAHIQTNSRGETLVYLRGAGERQVGLFLDGALLNIPWDNRFDLGLLPASVMGEVTAAVGVPAVEYGANVLGGAINVQTRTRESQGRSLDIEGGVGSYGLRHGAATGLVTGAGWRGLAHVGVLDEAAAPLSADSDLAFSQVSDSRRTNTDRQILSGLARIERAGSAGRLALTLLGVDAAKGIAPEGHLNPIVDRVRVRFWRYPIWRYGTAILSGEHVRGPVVVRGSAWASGFTQRIEQYASALYDSVGETQDDTDATFGARFVASTQHGAHGLTLALSGLTSQHDQVNSFGAERLEASYTQRIGSAGLVYRYAPTGRIRSLSLGAHIDGAAYPKTGDKPAQTAFVEPGIGAALRVRLTASTDLVASVGRKARFPTPRELFGVALGQFVLNPDLTPESAWLGEGGVIVSGERVALRVLAFARRTTNTLSQRTTRVDGQRFRQRVNLDGSRTLGIELSIGGRPWLGARLDGHITVANAREITDAGTQRMAEKPDVLATLAASQQRGRWVAGAVTTAMGRAYSADADGTLAPLPRSLGVSIYLARRFRLGPAYARAEVRADNLTDALVVPQRGLPAPGRRLRVLASFAL